MPKPRAKAIGDGKRVNIPVLRRKRDEGTQEDRRSGCWMPVQVCRNGGEANPPLNLRHDAEAVRPQAVESKLPRKASKYIPLEPYRKPTQVGGMNNPRRSRELWPRNSAK